MFKKRKKKMLGVNTNFRYETNVYCQHRSDWTIPRLLELGVTAIRDGCNSAAFIGHIRALPQQIKLNLLCDSRSGIDPSNVVALAKDIGLDRICSIESANEWDSLQVAWGDHKYPDSLTAYHTQLVRAIRADSRLSAIPILSPSFAQPENIQGMTFECDAISVHPYPGGSGDPTNWLDDRWLPLSRQICPGRPIVVTETGYSSLEGYSSTIDEHLKAESYKQFSAEYKKRGIDQVYYFELFDSAHGNFGLIDRYNRSKPCFEALKKR